MNLVELSQRIKQRRLELGLSLDVTAKAAGQTASWLSKVENFRITPSLPALVRVAEALDVSLSRLLEGLDRKPKMALTRKQDQMLIERDSENSNIRYRALVNEPANRQMNPFLLQIPAKGGRSVSRAHEGEEFLWVIEGKVVLEFGQQSFDLNEGDSLYFDATTPHRVFNPYRKTARIICVFHEK